VFFPAVSDYLLEPDTLMGNAAVMTATGASWTIGTGNFDGINYGLFYSDLWLARIVQRESEEIKRLGAKKDPHRRVRPRLALREGLHPRLLRRGRVAPGHQHHGVHVRRAEERQAQAARERDRGADDLPRPLQHRPLRVDRRAAARDPPAHLQDFVEMTPSGPDNYCCGGGGGTVSDRRDPGIPHEGRRQDQGRPDPRHRREVRRGPLRKNCKKQVIGLHDLIMRALDLSQLEEAEVPADGEEE
jgi:hypothetical protein